jgi:hypothetical protein
MKKNDNKKCTVEGNICQSLQTISQFENLLTEENKSRL